MTPSPEVVRPSVIGHKLFNKIFCIGANKTGTSSLEGVLRGYGYEMPDQKEQEIRLTLQTRRCDYYEFKTFVEKYDAFQDLPFSESDLYVAADALFPNSKFILSEREPEAWFQSLSSYHRKIYAIEDSRPITEDDVKNKFNYLFPGYDYEYKKRFLTDFSGNEAKTNWGLLYDKEFYIEAYKSRNNRVKKYFQECAEKLLVIDVTKETDTRRICRFLGIPDQFVAGMPHLNRT